MKKNLNLAVLLVLMLCFIVPNVFALDASVLTETYNTTSVYKLNQATPGTTETQLGTRLQGPLATGTQTDTEGTYAADNTSAETITETFVDITTGANWGSSTGLADGYVGQEITFTLTTDGGQNHKITPVTKTGFTDITLNDAGDSVTMKFYRTKGWVVTGGDGYNIDSDFGATTISTTGTYAGDNTLVAETITEDVAVITTPATWGTSTTLDDGYIGQELTFVLETDGGQDHTVSPSTKKGFTSITLSDANDSVTVKFTTEGWILTGNAGATIN